MATIQDAKAAWNRAAKKFKPKTAYRYALTGDGLGSASKNFYYTPDQSYIWAREVGSQDKPFPILNRGKVGPSINLPIVIGYADTEPEREQVLDINWDALPAGAGGSTIYSIGAHAAQHMFGGGDDVYIDSRLFIPGLVHPTSPPTMYAYIKPFIYYYNTWNRFSGGTTRDLSVYVPQSGAQYLLIGIDAESGTVIYRTTFVDGGQQTWDSLLGGSAGGFTSFNSDVPAPLAGEIPLGICYLTSSTSVVDWISGTNLLDGRLHFQPSISGILERLQNLENTLGISTGTLPLTGAEDPVKDIITNASALWSIPVASATPNHQDYHSYSSALGKWIHNNASQVKNDFRIGEVNAVGAGGSFPGYGNKLYLSGGPASDLYDSENSDPLWISRYNIASDVTELHVSLGDNQGANSAAIVFGSTDNGGSSFNEVARLSMDAKHVWGVNTSQVDTTSMIASALASRGSFNFYLDTAASVLRVKVRYPDGGEILSGAITLS